MGRKKPVQVEREQRERDFNTWRLLVRHSDFLKDLASLQNRKRVPRLRSIPRLRRVHLNRLLEVERVAEKWGQRRWMPSCRA